MVRYKLRVMMMALALATGVAGIGATTPTAFPSGGRMVALATSADFEPGSSQLTERAQEQLSTVSYRTNVQRVQALVVTGFSETSEPLAMERARSVKAFFILHGVLAERIYLQAGLVGNDRPGQISFEIVTDKKVD